MAKQHGRDVSEDRMSSDSTMVPSRGAIEGSKKRTERELDKDNELIRLANARTVDDFKHHYIDRYSMSFSTCNDKDTTKESQIVLNFSSGMGKDEMNACFNLVQSTSQADYEASSFGWHPRRKRREMKEEEMRYLLVCPVSSASESGAANLDSILGFLSFMLTHDSTPSVPVLYIYEIHLDDCMRGCGLGKRLMSLVEGIAQRVGVQKTMLTCFLSNEKARQFYLQQGYLPDACSPEDRVTRNKIVRPDYVIMSKGTPP